MPKKAIIVFLIILIILIYFIKTENSPKIDINHIEKINNFYSKNSNITISKYLIKENYTASLFLRDNNFRILAYKKNNLELDVGCNNKYFWYWDSAQISMYYSDRAAAHIVFEQILDPECFLSLFESNQGESKVNDKRISTIFDGKNTIIKTIYDSKNKMILRSDVIYGPKFPKEIHIHYTENNIYLKIEIKDVVTEFFDNNVLEIPNIKSEKLLP